MSEWVISKNLQPIRNPATEYINVLQANSNKLQGINETIKKYNHALFLCREGHEDMAAIQLRKILAQNPKLIKGYHLLALIQIKNGEWNRARKILKKAVKIDKTNTTTLRFLREVDEQTGVPTRLERKKKGLFRLNGRKDREYEGTETEENIRMPVYREHSKIPVFLLLMCGIAAGAAAFWLLAVPAIRQDIYKEANQQIISYSESLATQGAELTRAQGEALESGATAEEATEQLTQEQAKSQSYEALLTAYAYLQQDSLDEAAVAVQNVRVDVLPDNLRGIYTTVRDATGVTGIGDTEAPSADSSGDENTGESSAEEGYYEDNYSEEYYDDSYYEDSYYE